MFIDFSFLIQLVFGGSFEKTLCIPRHSRDAANCPSHDNDSIRGLPDTKNFDPYCFEEHPGVKAQGPEHELVVINPGECNIPVSSYNIDVIPTEMSMPCSNKKLNVSSSMPCGGQCMKLDQGGQSKVGW